MTEAKKTKSQVWKVVVASLVIVAGVVYSSYSLFTFARGIPPEPDPITGERPPGPPSKGEAKAMFREMAEEAEVTWGQKLELRELRKEGQPGSPEEGFERFEKAREILTPEQQEVFRSRIEGRMESRIRQRLDKARRTLPPDQYKIFEERIQKRREEMRARFQPEEAKPGSAGDVGE
ncbi:MAG: hypothetical protein H6752_19015 [Candidatus Omnitrophica bacterium]|nr:hypothetical protein [Candidatus Omnitrophota bacterium]